MKNRGAVIGAEKWNRPVVTASPSYCVPVQRCLFVRNSGLLLCWMYPPLSLTDNRGMAEEGFAYCEQASCWSGSSFWPRSRAIPCRFSLDLTLVVQPTSGSLALRDSVVRCQQRHGAIRPCLPSVSRGQVPHVPHSVRNARRNQM